MMISELFNKNEADALGIRFQILQVNIKKKKINVKHETFCIKSLIYMIGKFIHVYIFVKYLGPITA